MTEKPWYKSYPVEVNPNSPLETVTISKALRRTAEKFPDNSALNFMGKRISYKLLEGMVNAFARGLAELGIQSGDKVALCLPNIPQAVIANMAIFRIGAVAVQNNPLYTERELSYQLNDADARLVITLSVLVDRMEKLKPQTRIENIIACDFHTYLPFPKKQFFPLIKRKLYRKIEPSKNLFLFHELIARHETAAVEDLSQWKALAALIYTGGTTGVSKGVMLSHANLSSNVQQFVACFPSWTPGCESMVGNYPIFHSAGFNLVQNFPIWQGFEHIMVPRPSAQSNIDILKKYKPSLIPAVPTIFHGLLSEPEFRKLDLSFVKGIFSGAAPLSATIIRELGQLTAAPLCEVYGLTEASPLVSATPQAGTFKAGSVGVPVPHTDVRIVDLKSGEIELGCGQIGEIIIRGPQIMSGYYKRPAETEKVLRNGWLYTGDVGIMDEDGYLTVIDRTKDVIIAGGYNIYPMELDGILGTHPKIQEACAVGVPDAYRGETVKAYIVPKSGQTLSEEEVLQFCRKNLAPYKVPRIIEFTGELPKSTAVGKVLRKELRKLAVERMHKEADGPESIELPKHKEV